MTSWRDKLATGIALFVGAQAAVWAGGGGVLLLILVSSITAGRLGGIAIGQRLIEKKGRRL